MLQGVFIFLDKAQNGVFGSKNSFFYCQIFIEIRVLWQKTYLYSFTEDNLTAIGEVFTCHYIKKSGFTGTVFGNKGYFLIFIDTKGDIFEDNSFAKGFRYIFYW